MIKVLRSENDELREKAAEDAKMLEATKRSSDDEISRMSKELDQLLTQAEQAVASEETSRKQLDKLEAETMATNQLVLGKCSFLFSNFCGIFTLQFY